jgi:hypothetical protein
MTEDELDLEREWQSLQSEYFVCRGCGEGVPCHPIDAALDHALKHGNDEERPDLIELRGFFTRERYAELVRRWPGHPRFVDYLAEQGLYD